MHAYQHIETAVACLSDSSGQGGADDGRSLRSPDRLPAVFPSCCCSVVASAEAGRACNDNRVPVDSGARESRPADRSPPQPLLSDRSAENPAQRNCGRIATEDEVLNAEIRRLGRALPEDAIQFGFDPSSSG